MWRTLALFAIAACGRLGFGETDASTDSAPRDVGPDVATIAITSSGAFLVAASELRRTLASSTSTRSFTFATWYRSATMDAELLCAGTGSMVQNFLYASSVDGRVGLQEQLNTSQYAAYPTAWSYADQWVHLVVSVDLDQPVATDRVRWWYDGVPQTWTNSGAADFPQGFDLLLGSTILHTFGNKWSGNFNWTGSLADTYLIWGHALDASAFVTTTQAGVRSVAYAGPVTAESLHFDYTTPGQNLFPGQPDWAATQVTTSLTNLPY